MASKSKKMIIADTLSSLTKENYERFCHALLDRKGEPRIRRNRVEGKSILDITDSLVSAFTDSGVVDVVVDLLRQIGCNEEASELVEDTGGQSPKPGTGDGAGPSAGPTEVITMTDGEHFVDKHRGQLIARVTTIGTILDELYDARVIQQEIYEKIRALPTTRDKMRELYCGGLQASRECKDIFLKILEKNEPYLIADLKK